MKTKKTKTVEYKKIKGTRRVKAKTFKYTRTRGGKT